MSIDRAELAGTGAALAFHIALVAALSLSLAQVDIVPEPPSMEVEFVDEVALEAAAPSALVTPPPPSEAPEISEAEPVPAPRIEPAPAPRLTRSRPTRPEPAKTVPAKPAPRVSRIGDDFLKGIAESPARSNAPAQAAAATFSAAAKANVAQAIKKQIQPCADRQNYIGEGAERIVLSINLRLGRNGRLTRPLQFTNVTGEDDDNARYVELVKDQARRVYTDCSPLRLPAELYQTPQGGWGNINLTYRVQ